MELKEIEELMRAGDLHEAASALREKIQIDAENSRTKVLLGVCLHLLGDEEESSKIDRELVDEVGVEKTDVRKFHAFKVAASCAMMVLATSTAYGSYGGTEPLYGVFCQSYRVSVVFEADGGTGFMFGKSVSANTCKASYYTLPNCTFKKAGHYFDGWMVEGPCFKLDDVVYPSGVRIDLRDFTEPWEEGCATVILRAVWRESVAVEDDWLSVFDDGTREIDVGEWLDEDLEDYFVVSSGSPVTITVSGLPTGVRYDAKMRRFSGRPTRKGVYYPTCSAKNINGYQQSATVRWIVGDASEGDFDDIGLSRHVDLGVWDTLQVGKLFEAGNEYYLFATSVSGLPPGLKWRKKTPCPGGTCEAFAGTPTKAGKYRITFTDAARRKTVKTVIVRDAECRFLNVSVGRASRGRGTVSGGGVKKSGTTVKLSARPTRGYYFAGWYTDEACTDPFQGTEGYVDHRLPSMSFVFSASESKPVYAKFVTKAEDADIELHLDDEWRVDTGLHSDMLWVGVSSVTQSKVTAKGLPSGVRLQGQTLIVSDTSKLKPGTTLATLTAKNLSGATVTKTVRIVVPNLQSWVFDGLEYEGVAYSYRAGMSYACTMPYGFSVAKGWSLSASGLPSGLRLNFNRETGYAELVGSPTKAGIYAVVLTAKNGNRKEMATFTVEVEPFPVAAIGTYGGIIGWGLPPCRGLDGNGEDDLYGVDGTLSLTIAANGKISVRFSVLGKSYSLSGFSCQVTDSSILINGLYDNRGNGCDLEVDVLSGEVSGTVWTEIGEWNVSGASVRALARANVMDVVEKLAKLGKIGAVTMAGTFSCPACVCCPPPGQNVVRSDLTFTVNKNGTIRSSGKIEDRSVSGSSILRASGTGRDAVLFADFYDYKAGRGWVAYRIKFEASWIRGIYVTGSGAVAGGSYAYGWDEPDCDEDCRPEEAR